MNRRKFFSSCAIVAGATCVAPAAATATPAAGVVTRDNLFQAIADAAELLDAQNICQEGRWIAVPEWVAELLEEHDIGEWVAA